MSRPKLKTPVETSVLSKSKRRCALCFGLNNDATEKIGQIAHINGRNDDNREDNLVFLCFNHHDKFDSTTRQSKNYTQNEVKQYRDQLYKTFENSEYSKSDVDTLRSFLKIYGELFSYLSRTGGNIAHSIDTLILVPLEDICTSWYTNELRSYNPIIQKLQDNIVRILVSINHMYQSDDYHMGSRNLIFTWKEDQEHNASLTNRINDTHNDLVELFGYFSELQKIATKQH